jgi:hypothetical protein
MQHISILPVNLCCYGRDCCQLLVHIYAIDLAWYSSASHICRYLTINNKEKADVHDCCLRMADYNYKARGASP